MNFLGEKEFLSLLSLNGLELELAKDEEIQKYKNELQYLLKCDNVIMNENTKFWKIDFTQIFNLV